MPDLDSMYHAYRDQDLLVYGLHSGEDPSVLEGFLEQIQVSFPVVQDEGTVNLFDYPDGTNYPYPRDVVIGKDGTIRSIKNSFDPDETEALILELLAE